MTRPDDLLAAAVDRRESLVLAVLSYRAARATEAASLRTEIVGRLDRLEALVREALSGDKRRAAIGASPP